MAQKDAEKFCTPRMHLPPLSVRLNDIKNKKGKGEEITIAAYGPSLSGLLDGRKWLFLEHLNDGGTLLLAFLSPNAPPPRFEDVELKGEIGLENAINETLKIVRYLEEEKEGGHIQYETFDVLPDGSVLILDLGGRFEQVQYQLGVAGCDDDLLPIIISDRLDHVHRTIKASWNCVWAKRSGAHA